MYKNIGTRLPEDVVKNIEYVAEEEKVDKSSLIRKLIAVAIKERLIDLAMEKYSKREISLGKAAKLAQLPLADFMVIAAKRKIPMNYSVEWLKEDIKAVMKSK